MDTQEASHSGYFWGEELAFGSQGKEWNFSMIHTGIMVFFFFFKTFYVQNRKKQRTPGSTINTFTDCTILNKLLSFSEPRSTRYNTGGRQ